MQSPTRLERRRALTKQRGRTYTMLIGDRMVLHPLSHMRKCNTFQSQIRDAVSHPIDSEPHSPMTLAVNALKKNFRFRHLYLFRLKSATGTGPRTERATFLEARNSAPRRRNSVHFFFTDILSGIHFNKRVCLLSVNLQRKIFSGRRRFLAVSKAL